MQRPGKRGGGAPVSIDDFCIDDQLTTANNNNNAVTSAVATNTGGGGGVKGRGEVDTTTTTPPAVLIGGVDPHLRSRKRQRRVLGVVASSVTAAAGGETSKFSGQTIEGIDGIVTTTTTVSTGSTFPPPPTSVAAMDALLSSNDAVGAQKELDSKYKRELEVLQRSETTKYDTTFANGVPDMEAWDIPFYEFAHYDAPLKRKRQEANADISGITNLVHHPMAIVMKKKNTEEEELSLSAAMPVPGEGIKLVKTKDEIRRERRAAKAKKQEEKIRAVKAGKAAEVQRLTTRNLGDVLAMQSVLDPVGASSLVQKQQEERLNEHLQRNWDRHMEALPQQIQQREAKLRRDAEQDPRISVFRVFPLRGEASFTALTTIRLYACDSKMKGVVLCVGKRDCVIVLVGGRKPTQHLTRWITEGKIKWPPGTRASKLFEGRVQNADCFSFYEMPSGGRKEEEEGREAAQGAGSEEKMHKDDKEEREQKQEYVYRKDFDTPKEARTFMAERMPPKNKKQQQYDTRDDDDQKIIWDSLTHIWDIAVNPQPSPVISFFS